MTFRINGTDVSGMIAASGVEWQRNDVEGPNAGRTLSARMERDRVAIKITLQATCRPLRKAQTQQLLRLIEPEYVSVTYDDPLLGDARTAVFYSNNVPAKYYFKDPNGVEWWDGIAFPLVEV